MIYTLRSRILYFLVAKMSVKYNLFSVIKQVKLITTNILNPLLTKGDLEFTESIQLNVMN